MLTGCSHPSPPVAPQHQDVAGMIVTLLTNNLHTGDNTLSVTLTEDATQGPIPNANITAKANMLSPKLPGIEVSGRAQGNGLYNIPVRLGIATRYNFALHIERTGQPAANVSFPVEAAQ